MSPVGIFLLSIAAIFLIGALGEVIFKRTNIPDVIWLIVAGILLGPIAGIVTRDQLGAIAPYFAAVTLVVVLFEGGSALHVTDLLRAAKRSSLLAVLTFLFSMVTVAVMSMGAAAIGILPEEWTWLHGFLAGSILGGSSSIIIMPAMAQAKVEPELANLVNIESALTDALCVVGTAAIIDIILGGAVGGGGPAGHLLVSFSLGIGIAFTAGMVWLMFLRLLNSSEHNYSVTISALLILYVVIDRAGGSAALGILTFAVVVGNGGSLSRLIGLIEAVQLDDGVRGFHKQMTFMVKSFFFVFIGAMLGPPWLLILLGILIGGTLLVVRAPGVLVATAASGLSARQKKLVVVAMPRGMAAGVLATLPMAAGVPGTETLPVVAFAAVFTTIVVFAVGFPILRGSPATTGPALAPAETAPATESTPDASAGGAEISTGAAPQEAAIADAGAGDAV
jgi:cell volume regulation protein A